jgi:hypothetical protein
MNPTLKDELSRHRPGRWGDEHWEMCDPSHPLAFCSECDESWPCLASRALAELEAAEAKFTVERLNLIRVVSDHPWWEEENVCNLCSSNEPYEQHIATFLAALDAKPKP